MVLSYVLCTYVIVVQLGVLVGLLTGAGVVSKSFACSADPFPLSRLNHPALIWKYIPSHIVTCCAILGSPKYRNNQV